MPCKAMAKEKEKEEPACCRACRKEQRDHGWRGTPTGEFRFKCLPLAVLAVASGIFGCALVPTALVVSVGFHATNRYSLQKPSASVLLLPQQTATKPTNITTADCNIRTDVGCWSRADPAVSPEEEQKEAWRHIDPAVGDDDALMQLAAMAADSSNPALKCDLQKQQKKVAFMFLAARGLPLRPLWERFFTGHDDDLFNIYVHASPDYQEEPRESSVFYGRRIPSKPVRWGRASMTDAERRLLARALLDDPCNDRFVLLSDSCIPLYNFSTVYRLLVVESPPSHVGSFDDPHRVGRGRYSSRMLPLISLADWRKGSQWFEVHRDVAVLVVSDRRYYPVFRTHCLPPCYVDEHYIPTLVTKVAPAVNSGRSITWVDWSKGGSHPKMFKSRDVSEWLLYSIRRAPCGEAKDSGTCFLFARKFDRSCLGPLLKIAPRFMGFHL